MRATPPARILVAVSPQGSGGSYLPSFGALPSFVMGGIIGTNGLRVERLRKRRAKQVWVMADSVLSAGFSWPEASACWSRRA